MPSHDVQLILAFNNCVDRGATKQQLQDFVDRCRVQWTSNSEMLAVVDGLQNKI
ncbi:hypothetical protein RE628_11235 [Paenibacillus sp. D2_2]|uniref:hypothetical protein n=1 Tax=Paenibacillus sp. D2_2 TaxID=3073092 RepID=UPI0028156FA6|nr:hypothetical protein [Paenibacillus sp. D2_2]WMT42800.1 hypothetical protein RE628_11235 [Paenibacillus sp. D2_2]